MPPKPHYRIARDPKRQCHFGLMPVLATTLVMLAAPSLQYFESQDAPDAAACEWGDRATTVSEV
jgi:hypothetical protein